MSSSSPKRVRIYTRICISCGDVKQVQYRPNKNSMCSHCSGKHRCENAVKANTKKEEDKVRYWYFCPTCPSIRVTNTRRKSPYCTDCSRARIGKNNKEINAMKRIALPRVKHLRICPYCPEGNNVKQVNCNAKAGIRPCNKHRYVDKKPSLSRT